MTSTVKIAIAQINCVVGDLDGNAAKILLYCEKTWGPLGPLTTRPDPDKLHVGINICADAWEAKAPRAAREAGAQVLLSLNASPYHMGKQVSRDDVMRERVTETGMALVYANL